MKKKLSDKINELESWFSQIQGALVAFSGGVDSSLVLYLAKKFKGKQNAIGIISNSESLKENDFIEAQKFSELYNIKLEVIKTTELSDSNYYSNPVNRCYFCKDHLYSSISLQLKKYPHFSILNGTNYSDLGDYRPGNLAASEHLVLSPLLDCKISKEELRELAYFFGLPNWDKPASPCLSSRIPYHQKVSIQKLKQIELAEEYLKELGFVETRVRHFENLAKIEVLKKDLPEILSLKDTITEKMQMLGFEFCEIDLDGLKSGNLNKLVGK